MVKKQPLVYMDYQATTPVDPRILEEMLPYFSQKFGNPHSQIHTFGLEAAKAVEEARKKIASLIGADSSEIIFTSGATEANNLALKGVAHFYGKPNSKNHIITLKTEHKCVLNSCKALEKEGFEVTYLPVTKLGLINFTDLKREIRKETLLVSVMFVNNETGIIQPIREIGALCKENGIFFHSDAAQAFGKLPISVKSMHLDLMSISGHKIYAPKGIGALYVSKNPTRIKLKPIFNGGLQERGMRPGTLPTPLIVALGAAAKYANEEMEQDYKKISYLSKKLLNSLLAIPAVYLNGSQEMKLRYPGCINLSFSCIEGESIMGAMKNIAVSSGSACTSASLEPSYVLKAMEIDDILAHSSIRIGIGKFTTEREVDYVIDHFKNTINKLRNMSPLWAMMQEGIDLKKIQWKSI